MSEPRSFQDDLVALMRKHRFRGVPPRAAATIRTAVAADDQRQLNEWLPRAAAQMLRHKR